MSLVFVFSILALGLAVEQVRLTVFTFKLSHEYDATLRV